jgi:EamA domain-containing membrane protein RarD
MTFVLLFYWLPLALSLWFFTKNWESMKQEFMITRIKHVIVFCFFAGLVSFIPLLNWMIAATWISIGIENFFKYDDEKHWWNKKI